MGKPVTSRRERQENRVGLKVTVADELEMILDNLGFSVEDLAKLIHKTPSRVRKMLKGNDNMSLSDISDICSAIGVEPRVVFTSKETGERLNPDYTGEKLYE